MENLYLTPAEWLNRGDEGPGRGPGRVADPLADGLPGRAEFVGKMLAAAGQTPEHWSAVYDRLVEERAGRASA